MTAAAKKETAKKAEKVTGVNKVKLDKVNREHMTKMMLDLGLEAPANDSTEVLVARFTKHFRETTTEKDISLCDVCGGESDYKLDACPFCGVGDESSSESGVTEKGSKKSSKALAKKDAAKTEIVKQDETPLNKAVEEVVALKGNAAVSMWVLGAKIRGIYDAQLWKLRSDEEGKPKYKAFDAFCHHELGMSPRNAYNLMDISKVFNEEDTRKFGTSKLGLLLQAPPEAQEVLKEKLEKGASKRELEEEVRKAKKEKGGHRRETGRKKMPAGEKTKTRKRSDNLTIASIVGKKTIKLYQKPATRNVAPADLKRARKIGDRPWGKMELENEVTMTFQIVETPAGDLTLVVETKREE